MSKIRFALLGTSLLTVLGGCGLTVPEKQLFSDDAPVGLAEQSRQGQYENALIGHINCEIRRGIWRVRRAQFGPEVPWLYGANWGTAVNLQIQVDEMGRLSPGVSLMHPFRNAFAVAEGPTSIPTTAEEFLKPSFAPISRFFSLGLGGSASAHSSRQETIQYTLANALLLKEAEDWFSRFPEAESCRMTRPGLGFQMESDLKIDDFIYDKASIASYGNVMHTRPTWAPFNTFQETITFVATFNGSATPTWKLARATVNPDGQTALAERSNTNTLIITMGALDASKANPNVPLSLGGSGLGLHASGTTAALISNAIKSSSP
jgi:hypothetical protein